MKSVTCFVGGMIAMALIAVVVHVAAIYIPPLQSPVLIDLPLTTGGEWRFDGWFRQQLYYVPAYILALAMLLGLTVVRLKMSKR